MLIVLQKQKGISILFIKIKIKIKKRDELIVKKDHHVKISQNKIRNIFKKALEINQSQDINYLIINYKDSFMMQKMNELYKEVI